MTNQETFSAGNRVQFKVNGQEGIFYGVVTRIHNGAPLIQPEKPLSPRAQLVDIKKVTA